MRLRPLGILVLLLGMVVSLAAPALADNSGHGNGKGNGKSNGKNKAVATRRIDDDDRDRDRDRKNRSGVVVVNRRPERDRDVTIVRTASNRPPGWSHGRKVGWGNCDLPPGQAKKYGCSTDFIRRSTLVRFPLANNRFTVVRVPNDFRGWYWLDNRDRLWVDNSGRFWLDNRQRVPLVIVTD